MAINFFSYCADALEWLFLNLALCFQECLNVNYFVVDFIMQSVQFLSDHVLQVLQNTCDILHCYFRDFVLFSNEFALIILTVFISVKKVISNIVNCILEVFAFILQVVDILCLKTLILSNVITNYAGIVAENVTYVIQLIFKAILLILQLGPNLIILFYQLVLYLLNHLWILLNIVLFTVLNALCNLRIYFLSAILNVPPKAYIGLIICFALIYAHRYFSLSFKLHAIRFLAFFSKIMKNINHYFHALFKTIVRIFVKSFSVMFKKRNSSHLVSEQSNIQFTNKISKFYNCLKVQRNILKFSFYKSDEICEEKVKHLQQELTAAIDRQLCIICHERERNVIFFPCRHLCLCEECTETLQQSFQDCPLCRMRILNALPVYT